MQPIDWTRTGVKGAVTDDTFGCNVFKGDFPTPDRLEPDEKFTLQVHTDYRATAPDGQTIRFWGFTMPESSNSADRQATYPSPLIRARQGQIIHTTLITAHGPHTIHHHAIEPTTMNDGVGHVSFEVGARYTYQWQAGHAGTFFYHCHRNTVLHFEMGMVGPLVIDPPEGWGWHSSGGARYHVERIWLADDVDPRWHSQNNRDHDQGLCGEDVGLNRFEPKYFMINGIFNNRTQSHPKVKAVAKVGQSVLIRVINGSYSVLRVTLGIDATIVGVDGRVLGAETWNAPIALPANTPFTLGTGGRHDLLITPTSPGRYPARLQFIDWVKGAVHDGGKGVALTQIVVV